VGPEEEQLETRNAKRNQKTCDTPVPDAATRRLKKEMSERTRGANTTTSDNEKNCRNRNGVNA
jgi:hypothetical protein